MSSNKLPVPLSSSQLKYLMDMARRCKNEDLLSGDERKALFQAGRYQDWYSSRVERIEAILYTIREHFSSRDDQEIIDQILYALSNLDVELAQLEFDAKLNSETDADRFRRGEIYFERGNYAKAKDLFEYLIDSGYDTEDIRYYLGKLPDGRA